MDYVQMKKGPDGLYAPCMPTGAVPAGFVDPSVPTLEGRVMGRRGFMKAVGGLFVAGSCLGALLSCVGGPEVKPNIEHRTIVKDDSGNPIVEVITSPVRRNYKNFDNLADKRTYARHKKDYIFWDTTFNELRGVGITFNKRYMSSINGWNHTLRGNKFFNEYKIFSQKADKIYLFPKGKLYFEDEAIWTTSNYETITEIFYGKDDNGKKVKIKFKIPIL